jgi:hypothetical protein
MSFKNEMRLNNNDLSQILTACKFYQENTGNEWMWEQYEGLINKLKTYQDQYSSD